MSNDIPKEILFVDGPLDGEMWDTEEDGTPPDSWSPEHDASIVYDLYRDGFGGEWFLKYTR